MSNSQDNSSPINHSEPNSIYVVPQDMTLWSLAQLFIHSQEHLTMKDTPTIVEQIFNENPDAFNNNDKNQLQANSEIKFPSAPNQNDTPENNDNDVANISEASAEQVVASEQDVAIEKADAAAEQADEAKDAAEKLAEEKAEQEEQAATEQAQDAVAAEQSVQAEAAPADVVAEVKEVEAQASEEMVEEPGFLARNWLWLGALATGGAALALKDDEDPVPDPTVNVSDVNVNFADNGFTVSGTAEKNASVVVTVGNFSKTVTATEEGTYSVDFTNADLTQAGQGTLTITVSSNKNGGRVSETVTASVNVDNVVPDAPVFVSATDDNVINAAEVTAQLVGTAEADSTLTLNIAGTDRTIVVSPDGNWVYALTVDDVTALGEGQSSITVSTTDGFGNVSDVATFTIDIDTLAPSAPTFNAVTVDNIVNAAEITPTITGSAEANSSLVLTIAGTAIALTADDTGAWTYTLTAENVAALSEGSNTLTLAATDAAGNTSANGSQTFTLDTTAPSAPVINDATSDNVVSSGEVSSNLTGNAEANATVTLTIAGTTQVVTADANGVWSYTLSEAEVSAMGQGTEDITAQQTDVAGNTGVEVTKTINVDTVAPDIQGMTVDASTNSITLTYSDAIDATNVPVADNFAITVGNAANAVASVAVNGNEVTLVLTNAFASGQAVNINYVDAAGDQANAIQDIAGNDVSGFASGVVADGFVRGAQIYLDANGNGIADAGEEVTGVTTNAVGNFVLPNDANPDGHAIIAVGGVNIDTGAPNTVPLKAPSGATVINPLTTLVQTAVENNLADDAEAAQAIVKTALGITNDAIDLLNFEPISAISAGGDVAEAVAIQKAAVQVAAVVAQANQEKDTTTAQTDSNTILTNIVTEASAGNAIDLSDSTFVASALGGVTSTVDAAEIVAAATVIEAATDLTTLVQAQAEAIDTVAPSAPLSVSVTNITNDTTPTATVTFDTMATDGTAAVAGDEVTIMATLGDTVLTSMVVLTAEHIAAGQVSLDLPELAEGSYTVSAQLTDMASNAGSTSDAANALVIDLTSPNVVVTVDDATINGTETGTVTFTFDEDPGDSISVDDLTVSGGLISEITGTGLVRTATFTPLADIDQAASVTVNDGSFTDAAGNTGNTGTVEFTVDSKLPTVTITSDVASLKAGETATLTFTFSEAPGESFVAGDITVANGVLRDLTGDDLVYTATFTPSVDVEDVASITIASDSYVDAAGNLGTAGTTPALALDTLLPTLTLTEASSDENATAVATLTTSENSTIVLGEGGDTALFSLVDGALSFVSAPDFEAGQTSFTVNVVITDVAGNENTGALTITLNNLNEAPTAETVPAQTAVLDQAFSLNVAEFFADQDANDTLTFTITDGTLPAGLSLVDGVITGSPSAVSDTLNVQITATDANGLSVAQQVAVNVVAAPVVNSINIADNLVKAGDEFTVVLILSEAFTLTLNDASPTVTLAQGEQTVEATYASHDGAAGTMTFTAVAPSGDATGFSLSAMNFGAATVIGNLSAQPLVQTAVGQTDSDTVVDNTAATVTSDVLSVAENATTVGTLSTSETATVTLGEGDDTALFTLTDGVLSLNSAADFETDATSLTVNVNLTDTAGNTSTDSIAVTVTDVNEAPTGTAIAAQTAVVGRAFSLDLSEFFSDVDANDTLTYALTGDLPEGLSLTDGVLSGTATADFASGNVSVTATDAGGLTASQTFTISAVSAPTVASIEVKNGTSDLARAGETLTITLSMTEGYSVIEEGTQEVSAVFTFGNTDVIGTYVSDDETTGTVVLTVVAPDTDATSVELKSLDLADVVVQGLQSGQPIDTSVVGQTDSNFTLDSTPATITSDTLSVSENTTSVGTLTTSETATVTLGEGDDTDLFTLTDGVLSLNSAADFETDDTSLTVNVNLTDTAGNTSTDAIAVTVTNVNEAPTAATIDAQAAVVGQAFSVDLADFFSDVDAGDTLTYTLTGDLPAGMTFADGVLSGTSTAEVAATNLTVTAIDAGGLTASATFALSVVNQPVITTALSDIGDNMFDVRSDIVLQVNQAVSAVADKFITFTDNTAEGYQGETQTNSFTIAVTSDLVSINNETGLITVKVDENFDLDLASNYTMSIDDGAFVSTATGLATQSVADISFNTIAPTAGADNVAAIGQVDEAASKTKYYNEKWLAEWLADTTPSQWFDAQFQPQNLTNQQAFDLIGTSTLATAQFSGGFPQSLTVELLVAQSDAEYDAADSSTLTDYQVTSEAAQSYAMDASGNLVASSQWIDIEGLGNGTNSGNVASLDSDVEDGVVFKIDASTGDYVFVFSDQDTNGGDSNVGAGISTNTDFSVFLDEFGAGDQVYVDDAFNDADNLNVLAFEVFASGNGGDGAELFLGLTGGDGSPALYVGLEGDVTSTDDDGFADSTLEGVNSTLGLEDGTSVVITA